MPEIAIADSYGFNRRELSGIPRNIAENRDLILRASKRSPGARSDTRDMLRLQTNYPHFSRTKSIRGNLDAAMGRPR